MRYSIFGVVPASTDVTVYNDDGVTPATIYAASSGGSALSGGVVTSDASGRVLFFVDDSDYPVVSYFVISTMGVTLTGVWSFFTTVSGPVTPGALYTELDICNMALAEIGADPITALSDDNIRAKACNRLYAATRDAVQRAYPWNCCMVHATLTVDATAPAWGYAYRFPLPTSPWCLRALSLEDPKMTFKIVGRWLYTNAVADDANLRYTGRVSDPSEWDALLVTATAARLASALAFPVTGSKDLEKLKFQLSVSKIQEARSIDGQEGSADSIVSDEFTDFRQ